MTRPRQDPIIEKSQGQTDQRIAKLSFKAFEDEFGFKPDDKIEQAYYADHRQRFADAGPHADRHRAKRVKLDKQKKRLRSQ